MATTAKKTAKVVIPIDERETFVSLRKSFADSELSVEEKLKALYHLQEADNKIEEIVLLRGSLPNEVSALENEIAGYESKKAHLAELIKGFEANVEAAKDQIVELDAEIVKYREQLGNIANSREYDSIEKELENLNLLRQIAEKNINETKIQIENRKADIDAISDKESIVKDDLAAKQAELETIVESTAGEEEQLRAKREQFASKIDQRTMSAYERIRSSVKNHLAVVPLFNENSCGGCFNTIVPQRIVEVNSGKKLIICEHCGRIIVNPDAE